MVRCAVCSSAKHLHVTLFTVYCSAPERSQWTWLLYYQVQSSPMQNHGAAPNGVARS